MHKMFKILSVLFTFFILNAALTITVYAAIGYTATPTLPDNQRADVSAYFDLDTQPGLTQELSIKVKNDGDDEITVDVVALVASTNRNGEVVYTPFENLQLTPKYLITDMIQIPKSGIIIPANTTQEIPFILNVPDEPFGGIVLGSVRVLRVLSEAEADASGVVNQYAYSIPIRLHQGDAEVEPDFYLDNVEAELVHFSSSIVCNVVNPKPRLIRGMSIVAKVYPEGSDTPILEYVNEDASMAPESVMPLTLKGEQKEGFAGGNYIAKITLQYEGEEWNLEKEFTITVEEATNINEKIIINDEATPLSAPVIPAATNGLIYVGAFIILAIIVALIILRKYIKRYKEMAAKLETMTESQTGTPASEGKNTESYDVKNE